MLAQAGADGSVNATTSDYLSIVDSNLSYNKINPYVHESASYRVVIRPDRWLDADLTIRYTNVPAPSYVYANSYGPGAGKTGKPADYADFVRVLVPAGAELTSQSGWQGWPPSSAYGKSMFSGYLIVRQGQSRTVHLHYVVPPNVFSWSGGSRYRLLVQHQAGAHPDSVAVSVVTIAGPSFTARVSHPTSDWSRIMTIPVFPFRPLPLPAIPAPVVANGHWVEPYAYLSRR